VQEVVMADVMDNPYEGVSGEEERQAIYQKLQEKYSYGMSVYERHIKDWYEYRAIQVDQDAKFTKSVLTLSAGAFGVSFAFIDKIVPLKEATYAGILVASWGFLAAALVFGIAGHLASSFIHGAYCDAIHMGIMHSYNGVPYTWTKRWYHGVVTSALEIATFAAFIGGIVCLVVFVLLNL
jgi:hypothetical protein